MPAANGGSSNTPIGPFHSTVAARRTRSAYAAAAAGPISRPIQPSGTASVGTTCVRASAANASAATVSSGSRSVQPCSAARACARRAVS